MPAGVVPPSRSGEVFSQARVLGLHAVYRATAIHAISGSQLSIDGERRTGYVEPPLLRQPSLESNRSAWIEQTITSLALTGNAFWMRVRGASGAVVSLDVLNPHEVSIIDSRTRPVRFGYRGKIYDKTEIQHLALLRVPGVAAGLGPIQAARVDLSSAIDVRDYAADWFHDSGVPSGVLSSDQALTNEQAETNRDRWDEGGAGRTRVVGNGLTYTPYLLKPADAQWLENQKFDVTKVARLMGTPASLMLAAVEGTNLTYTNVEQEWIGYVRFSLMAYLREIEEGLSENLARGTNARFNIETLLRSDTKTRYEGHEIALRARFRTINEVRAIEGLPPIDGGDLLAPPSPLKEITA